MSEENGYWILGGYAWENTRKSDYRKKSLKGGKNRRLRFCKECRVVWQEYFTHKKKFITYPDMPTYGLERKKCKMCINKKELCNG